MKLACVAPSADWEGEEERFFVDLLEEAGLPVQRITFSREIPEGVQFVILTGREAISDFADVDPGLMLARPFVIRERPHVSGPGEDQQVGFPMLHWSSYRRNPIFRSHLKPAVRYLKHVAAMYSRGEFWFEEAPLGCVVCNRVEDGITLDAHWLPWCPSHSG